MVAVFRLTGLTGSCSDDTLESSDVYPFPEGPEVELFPVPIVEFAAALCQLRMGGIFTGPAGIPVCSGLGVRINSAFG